MHKSSILERQFKGGGIINWGRIENLLVPNFSGIVITLCQDSYQKMRIGC